MMYTFMHHSQNHIGLPLLHTRSLSHSFSLSFCYSFCFFASSLLHCLNGNILVSKICKQLERVCAYKFSSKSGSSNENNNISSTSSSTINSILSTFYVGCRYTIRYTFECLKAAFLPNRTGKPTSLKEGSSI